MVFPTNGAGTTSRPQAKNESRHRRHTLHKNSLKMDHRPKCKMQTINLRGNTGGNLDGHGFGDSFLDTIQKAQSMKEITDTLDLIKSNEKFLLCERHGQENEKTSHRVGENVAKTQLMKDCFPKYTKNS